MERRLVRDALYFRFRETTVTTKHLGEGIAADYDAAGRLAGIEILDAIKRLGDPAVLRQVILENVARLLREREPVRNVETRFTTPLTTR